MKTTNISTVFAICGISLAACEGGSNIPTDTGSTSGGETQTDSDNPESSRGASEGTQGADTDGTADAEDTADTADTAGTAGTAGTEDSADSSDTEDTIGPGLILESVETALYQYGEFGDTRFPISFVGSTDGAAVVAYDFSFVDSDGIGLDLFGAGRPSVFSDNTLDNERMLEGAFEFVDVIFASGFPPAAAGIEFALVDADGVRSEAIISYHTTGELSPLGGDCSGVNFCDEGLRCEDSVCAPADAPTIETVAMRVFDTTDNARRISIDVTGADVDADAQFYFVTLLNENGDELSFFDDEEPDTIRYFLSSANGDANFSSLGEGYFDFEWPVGAVGLQVTVGDRTNLQSDSVTINPFEEGVESMIDESCGGVQLCELDLACDLDSMTCVLP